MLIKDSSKESPLHPFNPNYLTDYRAYRLGLPLSVVDAIKDHRSQNRWINTVTEFQQLTQISDSTLLRIRPFLTFPKAYAKKRAKPLPIKKNRYQSSHPKRFGGIVWHWSCIGKKNPSV